MPIRRAYPPREGSRSQEQSKEQELNLSILHLGPSMLSKKELDVIVSRFPGLTLSSHAAGADLDRKSKDALRRMIEKVDAVLIPKYAQSEMDERLLEVAQDKTTL